MQIDKLLLYDGKLQLNKDKEKNLEINSNKINIRKRKKAEYTLYTWRST
jgi:hypothetical protein